MNLAEEKQTDEGANVFGMSIRKILVPFTVGENAQLSLIAAIRLAKGLNAHIEVVYVRPDPEDAVPYLGLESGNLEEIREGFRQHFEEIGKKAAAEARHQFDILCEEHGIAECTYPKKQEGINAHWLEVVGRTTEQIPHIAKFNDLTVFAGALKDYHRVVPSALECTLLGSGRPLLYSPHTSIQLPLRHVAIGWDETPPAVRAVEAVLPLCKETTSIKVFSVKEIHKETANPDQLVEYLSWHHLHSKGHVIHRRSKSVAQTLLDSAAAMEADLLVMGGYAHNRLQEAFFGGTTRDVIWDTQLPVFMMS